MEKIRIGVITACLVGSFATGVAATEWGPWSSNSKAPVIGVEEVRTTRRAPSMENPAARFLRTGVRFFQKYISPVDGDRCSMTPTCSHYSLQAIRKHGAFLGFVMSADRIVHEYEEQRFVPAVWDGMTYRFYDPVENNDFWFTLPDSGALSSSPQAGE